MGVSRDGGEPNGALRTLDWEIEKQDEKIEELKG